MILFIYETIYSSIMHILLLSLYMKLYSLLFKEIWWSKILTESLNIDYGFY